MELQWLNVPGNESRKSRLDGLVANAKGYVRAEVYLY